MKKRKLPPREWFELSDLSNTARKTVLDYVRYRARRLKLSEKEAERREKEFGKSAATFLFGRRAEAEHIRDFIAYAKTVNGKGPKKQWSSY